MEPKLHFYAYLLLFFVSLAPIIVIIQVTVVFMFITKKVPTLPKFPVSTCKATRSQVYASVSSHFPEATKFLKFNGV